MNQKLVSASFSFFNLIFKNELFDYIRDQTNFYALQNGRTALKLTTNEIRIYIDFLIYGEIVKAPNYKCCWKAETRFAPIADSMSRNRFEQRKRFMHFNGNTKM